MAAVRELGIELIEEALRVEQIDRGGSGAQPALQGLVGAFVLALGLRMRGTAGHRSTTQRLEP